ncbi:MAG TPA: sugar transferase [Burkholderiaceae bacterium]|nr:sugar transferase [Burkholderiaceae bacterium]
MNAQTFVLDGRAVQLQLAERSGPAAAMLGVLAQRIAAALLLIVFAPLMLWVAWRIWRVDGSPVLYGGWRVGRGGRLFRCLKFRTMVLDAQPALERLLREDPAARAQWEREQKLDDDPRVTPVGRFLRRSSLDELPQLFNVLRGDMALVGPRPITVPELERYGAARWHYLNVRPGMTGLWQVSGRSDVSYPQRVQLDRSYVEQRTLVGDVQILLRTVKVVLGHDGAR